MILDEVLAKNSMSKWKENKELYFQMEYQ